VLVVLGVPLALLATCATRRRTGLNRCAEHADIGRGLASEHAARGLAGVSAIEVEANAADQLPHVLLAETGVGAAGTRRGKSKQSSMQRSSASRSRLVGSGCAVITS
jgi:hypothetical protein